MNLLQATSIFPSTCNTIAFREIHLLSLQELFLTFSRQPCSSSEGCLVTVDCIFYLLTLIWTTGCDVNHVLANIVLHLPKMDTWSRNEHTVLAKLIRFLLWHL